MKTDKQQVIIQLAQLKLQKMHSEWTFSNTILVVQHVKLFKHLKINPVNGFNIPLQYKSALKN